MAKLFHFRFTRAISEKKTDLNSPDSATIDIYMLFTGWEIRMGKTVPEVLNTARGRRQRAVLKTKGTVFSHTDRPSPVNNIFFSGRLLFKVGKGHSVFSFPRA